MIYLKIQELASSVSWLEVCVGRLLLFISQMQIQKNGRYVKYSLSLHFKLFLLSPYSCRWWKKQSQVPPGECRCLMYVRVLVKSLTHEKSLNVFAFEVLKVKKIKIQTSVHFCTNIQTQKVGVCILFILKINWVVNCDNKLRDSMHKINNLFPTHCCKLNVNM